jgi:CYTH domain-containing protein
MEIERKYRVNVLPEDLSQYKKKNIEQGYLCHNPTIRVRKSNVDYILTYKSKFGLAPVGENGPVLNNEVELPLTEEAYLTLRNKTDGNMVYKTRYLIPLGDNLVAELDLFEGILHGLIIVEVEFPDIESADQFNPPSWFGKDLSSDKRFTNYHLSKLSDLSELGL